MNDEACSAQGHFGGGSNGCDIATLYLNEDAKMVLLRTSMPYQFNMPKKCNEVLEDIKQRIIELAYKGNDKNLLSVISKCMSDKVDYKGNGYYELTIRRNTRPYRSTETLSATEIAEEITSRLKSIFYEGAYDFIPEIAQELDIDGSDLLTFDKKDFDIVSIETYKNTNSIRP